LAAYHAPALPKQAKKFHIFHQRHFWKTANVNKHNSPTKYPVIAAPHSQQNPGVVRKAVRQSINRVSRQANPEVASDDLRIIHDVLNLIQGSPRNFSINMHKPKYVAARSAAASIHLYCPIGSASNELIAKARAEISGAIGASAVGDNDLRFGCSVTQMLKKWAYECRLIKDWNND
jgi:hypothetical protein